MAGCLELSLVVKWTEMGDCKVQARALRGFRSVSSTALPIRIVKPLRDKTVLARHKATLECTVSQSRGRVRWFRGDTEIFAGQKYEICNLDCYRTLVIHCVEPADEGLYTCDALDDRSTARLLVEGEWECGHNGQTSGLVIKGVGNQSSGGMVKHRIVCVG